MLDELEEIHALGDPAEISRRLDELDVRLERMTRSYAELDRAAASMRITETDRTGAVRVTVDAQGRVLDVVTTAGGPPVERIGAVVLDCLHRAQARIADEIATLATQVVGDGDEMAGHVVATMRERFPAPASAPESAPAAGPAVLDFTVDDVGRPTSPAEV